MLEAMRCASALLCIGSLLVSCGSTLQDAENPDENGGIQNTAPASRPAAEAPPRPSDAERERCELLPGQVAVEIPRPEGFLFQCDLADGAARAFGGSMNPMEAEILLQAFGIASYDAGPEQLLNDPTDGARQWVMATGVLGPTARPTGSGTLEVNGGEERYFFITGRPLGMSARREVLVLRVSTVRHNIVLMALFAPGDESLRRRALALLSAVRVEALE